jgi:very-short-patch-repair endonuclease
VDFCSRRLKLAIEVDGGQHIAAAGSDAERTRRLQALGYRVLRFFDHDVLMNTAGVLDTIAGAVDRSPSPSPSPVNGGGETKES